MTSEETITLTRREYDALIERNSQLEDMLAGQGADDGVRVPQRGRTGCIMRTSRVPSWRLGTTKAFSLRVTVLRKPGIAARRTSPRLSVG